SQAHSLDLLRLTGDINIPPAIAIETARHNSGWTAAPPSWISVTVLQTAHANQAQTWEQAGLLDRGEAEAVALTRQLRADWFLTDDTSARVLATSLGIEVHGSLGVVLWAAARDI
ncbi:MAG: hypothetical protein ACREDR_15970, partial [Blastocatellia bacterium]